MKYRPEIDGLRAIAVLSVLFFHAKFKVFSGGFVGVDIFFVISGYLITTIILTEINANSFSLVGFYERRARRILPALFTVLFISTIIVTCTFIPRDIKDFSQSLVTVIIFSSNILFWLESGYWDTSSELKPLLHTWSLAVEEQYYILFPIIVIILSKLKKKWTIIAFTVIILISLIYAHSIVYTNPDATFYLLPTRAWELAIGASIAYYFFHYQKNNNLINIYANNILSIIGISLITYSILFFNEKIPFPSIYTLIPTLGAGLIIAFGTHQTIIGKILSNKTMVFIGLISYSVYLWHQPILAFARYNTDHIINKQDYTFLLTLSLILGYISWQYIEKPFRSKEIINKRFLWIFSISGSCFFIILGISGHLTNGFEDVWLQNKNNNIKTAYRLISTRRHQNNFGLNSQNKQDNNDCQFNVPTINKDIKNRIKECYMKYKKGYMVFGDSHATDLFGIITSSPGNHPFVVGITQEGCRLHNPLPKCGFEELLAFISQNDYFLHNIYEQAGFYLLKSPHNQSSRELISNVPYGIALKDISINKIKINKVYKSLAKASSTNNNIIWFGPRIEPHISEKTILKKGCNFNFKLRENQYSIFEDLDHYIYNLISKSKKIHFISQNELLKYKFPRDFMNCQEIYWSDGDHLSSAGERNFGKRFKIKKLTNRLQ